ncbi:MAG: FKBP-type peptidyl-prolyl cis-trans isomerase [Thermodesulfobacteriota bacterium]|nr:FKBP-type peptidyl-prolyl cis-trans isomerase [Thermodesulfobacteriota bacterium]
MKRVERGDTVRVHYTRRLADGTVLDSSEDLAPVQFEIGGSQVVSGLERAVLGMRPGESRFTTITAKEGFGPYQERKVHKIDRREVPAGMEIAIGQQFDMVRPDGHTTPVTVKDISDQNVTLDANHPLAGMNLFFEIDLLAIL